MTKAIDLTGQIFNRLTVNHRAENSKDGRATWSCTCECGKTNIVVKGKDLRSGNTKSCGCLTSEAGKDKTKNLTGRTFGRLTVSHQIESDKTGRARWSCICECGKNNIEVSGRQLLRGKTRSCGCLYKETRTVSKNKKHGYFGTRIYSIWSGMMSRCNNSNHDFYHRYGGRGVKLCERWHKFERFLEDVGLPPSDQHTLDRFPDNDGNYEPSNVRWATQSEQCRNRSNNMFVNYQNQNILVIELAETLGIDYNLLRGRIRNGWSVGDAISTPKQS